MVHQEDLIAQANHLIQMGEQVLATESGDTRSTPVVNEQKFHDFRISTLSFLSRVFGDNNQLCLGLKSEVTHPTASRTRRGLAILHAARANLQNDWLTTVSGTIAKDMLVDMLRLAHFHLEQGQLSAAVIIGGALLEKELRLLALANDLPIHNELQNKAVPKRGLQLTGELYKKKVYSRQENKTIVDWLELYQHVAEASNFPVNIKQVKGMLTNIQALIVKTPL
jgi:hypothetical protein